MTAVTLVPLAVFGGVGFAHGNPSASEYEYGPSGHQYAKVAVCHKTHSKKHGWVKINVPMQAWLHAHSRHGDFLVTANTPCPPAAAPTGSASTNDTGNTHGKSGEHHGNNGK